MGRAILFWFYQDATLCKNRVRTLRHYNRDTPIYGLYGGPPEAEHHFRTLLEPLLDDWWTFPEVRDRHWKWRNGDRILAHWFSQRGHALAWDSLYVAQWDLLTLAPLDQLLPELGPRDMLLSGVRPVRDVESWWQWTNGEYRAEYDQFLRFVAARYGPVDEPHCCQFIGVVLPRDFLARYATIDEPELGFVEYKIPVYAQVFGTPLAPDTCFFPWWPDETHADGRSSDRLFRATAGPVRLPAVAREMFRSSGRRVFHPYRGVYPLDVEAVREMLRFSDRRRWHRREGSPLAALRSSLADIRRHS